MEITTPVIIFGITGMGCGLLLAVASRYLLVKEDPRIEAICNMLPGYNCGSCGYGGCSDYAKAIITEGKPINLCAPGGDETLKKLSEYLDITATLTERMVAIVLCKGGDKVAKQKALYNGIADCSAAELVAGGHKACGYGCLGLGSCARVCPVGAIEITSDNLAVVHPELCIGCGKCVSACPRHLIKLIPESRSIHVLCSSKDRRPVVKKVCRVGCIGCGLCAKIVNSPAITMDGALSVVNYSQPLENEEIIARCPQKTIEKRTGQIKQD